MPIKSFRMLKKDLNMTDLVMMHSPKVEEPEEPDAPGHREVPAGDLADDAVGLLQRGPLVAERIIGLGLVHGAV